MISAPAFCISVGTHFIILQAGFMLGSDPRTKARLAYRPTIACIGSSHCRRPRDHDQTAVFKDIEIIVDDDSIFVARKGSSCLLHAQGSSARRTAEIRREITIVVGSIDRRNVKCEANLLFQIEIALT